MHELFKTQSIFFYPVRIHGVNFSDFEVWPMKFDSGDCTLELASECAENEADFYSVFILIPEMGRDTIADCATKELAEQLKETLLSIGKNYLRE